MAQLQLSMQLIDALHGALQQHDPQAGDGGVAAQYLAATLGFTVATLENGGDAAQREELLEELAAFAQHVMRDVLQQQRQQQPQAQEAYGVWRPGDP